MTDLKKIKDELKKLGQATKDLRRRDLNVKLTPQAKARLKSVEKRFNEIKRRMQKLQGQVDNEVNKFVEIVRRTTNDGLKSVGLGKTTTKKSSKKKASTSTTAKTTRKAKKASIK